MSNKSSLLPGPLRVELRPSRTLRGALIVAGAAALFAIIQTSLPWSARLALAAVVILYLSILLRRHTGLWSMPVCTGLVWDGASWQWQVAARSETVVLVQAVVWPALIALEFRSPGSRRRRALVLLPDSADTEVIRQLRVVLRHLPVLAR